MEQTASRLKEGNEGSDGRAFKAEVEELRKLYTTGDHKGFINRFNAHPSLYFKSDNASKMRLLALAPAVGDTYHQLADNKNAAHYFALAAKIQKEVSWNDPKFKLYLDHARELDPDNREVKTLEAETPVR